MVDQQPNRAERRRQEKEVAKEQKEVAKEEKEVANGKGKATCTDCKEGPCDIAPKIFPVCPVCGCSVTFTVKAMVGDLQLEDILGKEPALFSFTYLYDTPTHQIKLVAVGASCARCGVFRTIAREKMKGITLAVPKKPGEDHPRLIFPR